MRLNAWSIGQFMSIVLPSKSKNGLDSWNDLTSFVALLREMICLDANQLKELL